MAVGRQSIEISCDEQLELHCVACNEALEIERVPVLSRRRPGASFDVMCIACWQEVVHAAACTLAIEEFVSSAID